MRRPQHTLDTFNEQSTRIAELEAERDTAIQRYQCGRDYLELISSARTAADAVRLAKQGLDMIQEDPLPVTEAMVRATEEGAADE